MEISGKVSSGSGGGAKFLKLPWVIRQIRQHLGFYPYPGTLNIKLSDKNIRYRKVLEEETGLAIIPAKGFCRGKLFKASIDTITCGVVIPQVKGYPEDLLELIAAVKLREQLDLRDGDEVTITVYT